MNKLKFHEGIALFLFLLASFSYSQYNVELIEQSNEGTVLKMNLINYDIEDVDIDESVCTKIILKDGVYNQKKGMPNLPAIVQSIIISDRAEMAFEIISAKTETISIKKMEPSKGSISRKLDPTKVPYVFGDVYSVDASYPKDGVELGKPYIVRDFRANTVNFYPFSYNSQKSELEIRTEIIVKVFPTSKDGENIKTRKRELKIDNGFNNIYRRKFINYSQSRYTPVDEDGDMLIISYGSFMSTVAPLVEWKNRKGIKCEIVNVSDIGNAAAIKTYVGNYYNTTNLKYLLLVGDYQQVPNHTSKSPNGANDPSDSKYGCIEGDDSYVEVFVGRFSGTTTAHIKTQVDKVLHYERELDKSDTWLNSGLGSADQSEADDKKVVDEITTELSDFTYSTVNYYQGDYNDDTQIVGWVNDGVGVFGVSTHANQTSISGLKSSSAAKMNNDGRYPYNFTLGCDPGDFTFSNSQDCLGEALLKKNKGGFIGAFMSSISQPWYEPYAALREFFDIITDQYSTNKKFTYGGVAMNGCMKMIDDYASQGPWVADTWILFGDPSLAIYTDLPADISITHPKTVGLGSQSITVTGTNGMTVALYSKEQGIQVKGVISGGKVDLSVDVTTSDTIYVTATGYNFQTYEGVISIVSGPPPEIKLDKKEVSVSVDLGNSKESNLTIENSGEGILNYSIKTTGVESTLLINELFVSNTAFFDGIELWNRGSETDMTGWSVSWVDSDNSSGSFNFPDGYKMGEGKTVVLTDVDSGSDANTFYVGKNLLWAAVNGVEVSVVIYNAENEPVDFVKTAGSTEDAPVGVEWIGVGVANSNDRIYRNNNVDNDDATDWSYADGEASVNEINPGQSLGGVVASWLTLDKYAGSIATVSNNKLTLTFNSTGLAIGDYYDTLYITHNAKNEVSPLIVPCIMRVGETGILDMVESAQKSGKFSVGPNPAVLSNSFVNFVWSGERAQKIEVAIFDAVGNHLKTLDFNNASNICKWNLRSDNGKRVSEGSYLAIVKATLMNGTLESYKAIVGVKR